jgi:hypothetical protein
MKTACLTVLGLTLVSLPALRADEASAIKAIHKAGGEVFPHKNSSGKDVFWVKFSRSGKGGDDELKLFVKLLAEFKELELLDLSGTPITDEGLKALRELKDLKQLNLGGTKVKDAGLKELAGLKGLQVLSLTGTQVTNDGLKELVGLKDLQSLGLSSTKVTDAGLRELKDLKSLRRLDFYGEEVTDAALRTLREIGLLHTLPQAWAENPPASPADVVWLNLRGTKVTNEGLKEIAGFTQLEKLSLERTKVTDEGLKELTGFKNLKVLYIYGTGVKGEGLKHLAVLTKLELLELPQHVNADEAVALWKSCKSLGLIFATETTKVRQANDPFFGFGGIEKASRHLDLRYTRLTDAGLKVLAELDGVEVVNLRGTLVSDKGLKELAKAKSLQKLDLRYTKVTAAGVAELKKALPKCEIIR